MGQGAYIFGCGGLRLTAAEKAFFASTQPWGFILFARNVDTPEQLHALTTDLRDSVGHDAPVMIDQEGGRVERMRAPYWRQWLPPMDQVRAAGSGAARSMWLRYCLIGMELRGVGIDCNCAPLADIATKDTHAILANRLYGTGAVKVTEIARAVADGLLHAGVLPVLKHMPGHGRAVADAHDELPVVDASLKVLRATDFAPFAALANLPMAMGAHIVYSDLDDVVATHSARIVAMIRDELRFQGLLMTDDISMQALSGTLPARAQLALRAGYDVILHCNGELAEMQALADASGSMAVAAQARADAVLAARPKPGDIDVAGVEAELTRILGDHPYV